MDETKFYETHEDGYTACTRTKESLPDLIEGYLDNVTAEAVRAHLRVCFFCAKLYGEMERTITLVETMPIADPLKDFAPDIMAKIRGAQGNPVKKLWGKLWQSRQ